jgi:hypothetical protein
MVHPCVRMALVEALRRALGRRHRQLGMIQPDRFIGLAERPACDQIPVITSAPCGPRQCIDTRMEISDIQQIC